MSGGSDNRTRRLARIGLPIALSLIFALAVAGCARKVEEEGAESNTAKTANKNVSKEKGASAITESVATVNGGSTTNTSPAQPSNNSPTSTAKAAAPLMITNIGKSLEAYRGKVVILDVWATWCGPCRYEIPGFIRLQDKYRDQGVEIIGVSIDPLTPRTGAAAVPPFMQQFGINYTIWMLNDQNGFGKYPIVNNGIPTTYVIDRKGNIIRTYVGVTAESQFENDIKGLL